MKMINLFSLYSCCISLGNTKWNNVIRKQVQKTKTSWEQIQLTCISIVILSSFILACENNPQAAPNWSFGMRKVLVKSRLCNYFLAMCVAYGVSCLFFLGFGFLEGSMVIITPKFQCSANCRGLTHCRCSIHTNFLTSWWSRDTNFYHHHPSQHFLSIECIITRSSTESFK